MKKNKLSNTDELTEKMHSEFTISKETELKIKVMIAKEEMKEFSYSVSEICELYGLTEEELSIDKNS